MSGGFPSPASREQWQEAHSVAKTDTAVLEHIPGLRRYARALTGSAADADDLVQECPSRALARRQQASDIRILSASLFTSPHKAHIDGLSQRRRGHIAVTDEAAEHTTTRPAPRHGRARGIGRADGGG